MRCPNCNHLQPPPAHALSETFKIGGRHPGYKKCTTCGVAGYVTEVTLLKCLQRGLDDAKFKIVSVAGPGEKQGTANVMLRPLMKMLRDKGMIVR